MRRIVARNPQPVSGFPRPADMDPLVYEVLLSRGVATAEEAQRFLHPSLDDLNDPCLLSDMRAAVDRIRAHLAHGSAITIYGDFDADGVTASSLLYTYLRGIGADVSVYIPNRFAEGYGLNDAAIRAIAQRSQLMVTVDCGVTHGPQIELAQSLGMECVVTDHHRPVGALPPCPTVNPLLADYPFPSLCGAGVAFQLVRALGGDEAALPLIDLATIGTVADLMPLTGENRVIAHYGLQRINEGRRLGIRALIEAASLQETQITAGHISFQLAPRINASGRMHSAQTAFELLTTDDPERAAQLAEQLNAANESRKATEQRMLDEAEAQLAHYDFVHNHVIMLWGEDWHAGVNGLAASKLLEKYHMPTLMFSRQGDALVGSCRSIEGVNIHAALCSCADLLTRFGGHKLAAGLTLPLENFSALQDGLNRYIEQNCDMACYTPVTVYDCAPNLQRMTPETLRALECFQPMGIGNPTPLFLAEGGMCAWRTIGEGNQHLKFELACDGRHDAIAFSMVPQLHRPVGGNYRVVFSPKENTFRGRTMVQLNVHALMQCCDSQRECETIRNLPEIHAQFLTELFYNRCIDGNLGADAPAVTRADIVRDLTHSAQGALVICQDAAFAFELIRECGGIHELYVGSYPDQPISYNAICLLPHGDMPAACQYDRVYLVDLPPALFPFESASVLRTGAPGMFRLLPGIDELRGTYVECRKLLGDGALPPRKLIDGVSSARGFSRECALSSLAVLRELELIADADRAQLRMAPMRKVQPDLSARYRLICALRDWSHSSASGAR